MKLVLGWITTSTTVEKASVVPPCNGYLTDFMWQAWTDNSTDPTIVALGDVDPTNDVMPESTELEAVFGKTNAEVFVIGMGNPSSGSVESAVSVKHSKKRIKCIGGKPLNFLVHGQAADEVVGVLTAQFVPKNGATLIMVRKDSTSLITYVDTFFIRILHDGYLKQLDLAIGVDGGVAPWNGTYKVYHIVNKTEISFAPTMTVSGDVIQPTPQDDTIGQAGGFMLGQQSLSVKAANEFTNEDLKIDKDNIGRKVYEGDIILVQPTDHRGTDPDNISLDLRIAMTVRNAKERKRNVFIDGTHVISYEGATLLGVADN